MHFTSNDYPLSKEYQSRIQRKVSTAQLADDVQPHSTRFHLDYRMGFMVIGLILVVGVFVLFTHDTAAQEAPEFDPGCDSESVTDIFDMAVFYLQLGMYDEAIEELTRVVNLDPEFGAAFAARGVAYHRTGRFDEAIADYSSAILIFPDYASAYNFRGLAHLEQHNYDEALADSQHAADLDPTYANAHLTMGEVYLAQEDYEAALKRYVHYVLLAGEDAESLVYAQIQDCKAQLEP